MKMPNKLTSCFLGIAILTLGADRAAAETWRIEAEQAGDGMAWPRGGSDYWKPWQVKESPGASGDKALTGVADRMLDESQWIPLRIPAAGKYRFWVRYSKPQDHRNASFALLLRNETGQSIAYRRVDFQPQLPSEKPYLTASSNATGGGPVGENEMTWECVEADIERPTEGFLSFAGAIGKDIGPRVVDCVVVTSDPKFDPSRDDWKNLPDASTGEASAAIPPDGLVPAETFIPHTSFFAGVSDPKAQIGLGLVTSGQSEFVDDTHAILLGFNRDHPAGSGSTKSGMMTSAFTFFTSAGARPAGQELARKYPAPEGRFVNSANEVGRSWSHAFPPFREAAFEVVRQAVEANANREEVEDWVLVGEALGVLDYSPHAQQAFQKWLEKRYGGITALNEAWNTKYERFDQVVPPADYDPAHKAAWFDFHSFNSRLFAEGIGSQVPVINSQDPKKRPSGARTSATAFMAPYFLATHPVDYEEFVEVALKDQPFLGYDDYCADDFLGSGVDFISSIAAGRKVYNFEWNVHSFDPRLAGRSFWTMVGKGVKAIHAYEFQDRIGMPKWGLLNLDFTPKDKLGAYSDAAP